MFHRGARMGRISLASVILLAALLAAPLTSASADGALTATIRSVAGASMGTATFTAGAFGGVRVQITVSGFNPVGGDRRLSIRNGAGAEVLVLPNIQFYPNGSANYDTVVSGISLDWLQRTPGATLIIQADSYAASEIIGWGQITSYGAPWYGPWQPGYPGGYQPGYPGGYQPQPQPHPQPQPQPPAIVGRVRVTASDGLRLRWGAGTQYRIMRIVPLGTVMESTGIYAWGSGYKWLKVRYGGNYYWAASAWLQAY